MSRLQPVTSGSSGLDAANRAGERQVDAVFSAVGADTTNTVFIGRPGPRNDFRAVGIGRNVDTYV